MVQIGVRLPAGGDWSNLMGGAAQGVSAGLEEAQYQAELQRKMAARGKAEEEEKALRSFLVEDARSAGMEPEKLELLHDLPMDAAQQIVSDQKKTYQLKRETRRLGMAMESLRSRSPEFVQMIEQQAAVPGADLDKLQEKVFDRQRELAQLDSRVMRGQKKLEEAMQYMSTQPESEVNPNMVMLLNEMQQQIEMASSQSSPELLDDEDLLDWGTRFERAKMRPGEEDKIRLEGYEQAIEAVQRSLQEEEGGLDIQGEDWVFRDPREEQPAPAPTPEPTSEGRPTERESGGTPKAKAATPANGRGLSSKAKAVKEGVKRHRGVYGKGGGFLVKREAAGPEPINWQGLGGEKDGEGSLAAAVVDAATEYVRKNGSAAGLQEYMTGLGVDIEDQAFMDAMRKALKGGS